jgi:hypothetical protein
MTIFEDLRDLDGKFIRILLAQHVVGSGAAEDGRR